MLEGPCHASCCCSACPNPCDVALVLQWLPEGSFVLCVDPAVACIISLEAAIWALDTFSFTAVSTITEQAIRLCLCADDKPLVGHLRPPFPYLSYCSLRGRGAVMPMPESLRPAAFGGKPSRAGANDTRDPRAVFLGSATGALKSDLPTISKFLLVAFSPTQALGSGCYWCRLAKRPTPSGVPVRRKAPSGPLHWHHKLA